MTTTAARAGSVSLAGARAIRSDAAAGRGESNGHAINVAARYASHACSSSGNR